MKLTSVAPLLIALSLSVSSVVVAQPPPHKKFPHGRPLFKALDLTEAQQGQFRRLREKMHSQMDQYKSQETWPSKEERKALRNEFQQEFSSILTPDQLNRLKELKLEGKHWKDGHRRHPRNQGFGLKNLDLSADQKTQLADLRKELAAEKKALFSASERPSREEMDAHREQMKTAINNILTDEQRQQLQKRRTKRRETLNEAGKFPGNSPAIAGETEAHPTAIEATTWGRIKSEIIENK